MGDKIMTSHTTRFLSILTSFAIAVCVLLCAAPCAYADAHGDTGLYLKAVDSPFVVTTPDKATITVGDTVTLVSTISGGFGEVGYSWSYSDDGGITWITLEGEQAPELTITPDKAGSYLYRLTASDMNGQAAYVDYPLEVVSPNSAGANDPGDTSNIMETILPKTGDGSPLLVFALTALGAAVALIVALRKRVFAGAGNMEREAFLSKRPIALFIGVVAAAIMAFLIVPASAHAAPVEDDTWFVVDQSLTATFDGEGNLSIPQATLHNNSDADVTLTSATGPDGYDWVCDGIGKTIPAHGSLSVRWTANDPVSSDVANEAALAGVLSIGAITYKTTDPVYTAFAVYSETDNSLSFYKRVGVPSAGDTFEGKTVTEVYTGIESGAISTASAANAPTVFAGDVTTSSSPFAAAANAASVAVVDPDIQPASCAYWFDGFDKTTSFDLAKLNTSLCDDFKYMFYSAYAVASLDLSSFDTSKATDMTYMLNDLHALESIALGAGFDFTGAGNTALCSLPVPFSAYIPNATGNWVAQSDGAVYAAADVPSNKADVYRAEIGLAGSIAVSGDATVGSTLTAAVSGAQDDAVLGYQWYRETGGTETVFSDEYIEGKVGRTFTQDFTVKSDNTTVTFSTGGDPLTRPVEILQNGTHVNVSEIDDQLVAEATFTLDKGDYTFYAPAQMYDMIYALTLSSPIVSTTISEATGSTYALTDADVGAAISCKASDTSGKYAGELASDAVGPVADNRTAFAVYSETDNSLNFYKRSAIPEEGSVFEGLAATHVWEGVEEEPVSVYAPDGHYIESPFNSVASSVKTVTVVDEISPFSCCDWFAYFSSCKSFDLAKLDTFKLNSGAASSAWGLDYMFYECSSVTELDISSFDNRYESSLNTCMFSGMDRLQKLTVGENFEFKNWNKFVTPDPAHIAGADGKWYDIETGLGYAPDAIPSNKAATYSAIPPKPALTGTVSVAVAGDSVPGDSLTATVSGLPDDSVPAYQWYRSGAVIEGAVSAFYAVTESDAGRSLVCKVSDTSGNYSGTLDSDAVNIKKKLNGTVTLNPDATVEGATASIHVNYTYSMGAEPVILWEYADDASGTNAAAVPIEENVIQCPIWGKYIRAVLTDGSGTYYGSVSSEWTGPATTEFYGSAEIVGSNAYIGERPGYSVSGPILTEGQSGLSNYKITWWVADDAAGTNKEPYAPLNDGGYIEDAAFGKYLAIEVSAKDEWSAYVTGSVMSEWVYINRGEVNAD